MGDWKGERRRIKRTVGKWATERGREKKDKEDKDREK